MSPHAPDEPLTIGEMTRRTGVAASALHFYEGLGLIASTRTPGNQRRYARHMLRRVSLITVAKRLGIPLSDVQTAFADVPLTETRATRTGSGPPDAGSASWRNAAKASNGSNANSPDASAAAACR